MEISPAKERRKRRTKASEEKNLKRIKTDDLEAEKRRLEKLVIGDEKSIIKNISHFLNNDSGLEDSSDEKESDSQFSDTLASPPRQPAWHDEDDNFDITTEEAYAMKGWRSTQLDGNMSQSYQVMLRKKFLSVFGEPSWAKLDTSKPSEDPDDRILQGCGKFIDKSNYLPKSIIDAKRVASLNSQTRNEGPIIKVLEFHPSMSLALVAGVSGTASILQVDGQINSKLSSVQFDKFPIKCGKFLKDGNKFVIGSNIHSHFYVYDMVVGKSLKIPLHHNMEQTNMKDFLLSPDGSIIATRGRFGNINLLTTSSYEWIGNLKMNDNATALAFNSTGSVLYTSSDIGEIYAWDMSSRTILGKWPDEGCLQGTCLAVSPNNSLLASGQSTGVVNIYSTSSFVASVPRVLTPPTPIKTLYHLTTHVSFLTFDSSSQLLAFGSDDKDNAIKLCHTPSMTVYSNFPVIKSNLGRIQCAAFSPHSGFLSFANNCSTAFLYRLKHFGNY